jgi:Fic family protein
MYGVTDQRLAQLTKWQEQLSRFDMVPQSCCDADVLAAKKRVANKLAALNELRPLDSAALRSLHEVMRVDFSYNSTAIEGNSLTLHETALVLREGITISEKPLRDHLQIIDNDKAFEFILSIIDDQSILVDSALIKKIHEICAYNDKDAAPGEYAAGIRYITGSAIMPPPPSLIADYIDQLVTSLSTHPTLEDIAQFHLVFEDIHPFSDVNGRTGRLLLNLMLIREGYPPISIKAEAKSRKAYYDAIMSFCDPSGTRDVAPMLKTVLANLEISLDQYLSVCKKTTAGPQPESGRTPSAK